MARAPSLDRLRQAEHDLRALAKGRVLVTSERRLAEAWGVHERTVRAILAALVERRVVLRERLREASGTFSGVSLSLTEATLGETKGPLVGAAGGAAGSGTVRRTVFQSLASLASSYDSVGKDEVSESEAASERTLRPYGAGGLGPLVGPLAGAAGETNQGRELLRQALLVAAAALASGPSSSSAPSTTTPATSSPRTSSDRTAAHPANTRAPYQPKPVDEDGKRTLDEFATLLREQGRTEQAIEASQLQLLTYFGPEDFPGRALRTVLRMTDLGKKPRDPVAFVFWHMKKRYEAPLEEGADANWENFDLLRAKWREEAKAPARSSAPPTAVAREAKREPRPELVERAKAEFKEAGMPYDYEGVRKRALVLEARGTA